MHYYVYYLYYHHYYHFTYYMPISRLFVYTLWETCGSPSVGGRVSWATLLRRVSSSDARSWLYNATIMLIRLWYWYNIVIILFAKSSRSWLYYAMRSSKIQQMQEVGSAAYWELSASPPIVPFFPERTHPPRQFTKGGLVKGGLAICVLLFLYC